MTLPIETIPFRCPRCRATIDWQVGRCSQCTATVNRDNGIIDFIAPELLDQQPKTEIDLHRSLSKEYEKRYRYDFAAVFSDYWNRQFLDHLPEECGMALDCGCGTGELAQALLGRADLVVGLDISREMMLQGQVRSDDWEKVTWVACPGETLPFADAAFDAVCFRGALHHMAHEEQGLREAYRVLKKGGLLLLSEPNDDSLLLRLPRKIVNRRMARFGNAHKAFRSADWLATIQACGFTIRETKYFSFLSQPLCGMSDLLPIMRFLPLAQYFAYGLVRLDEFFSQLPGIRQQSFDLFVVARKQGGDCVRQPKRGEVKKPSTSSSAVKKRLSSHQRL